MARCRPGPVLELACGTGRLTFPLAAAGIPVVGLDNALAMLALAGHRARARPVDTRPLFVASDMRRFALAARFGLVFVAYNSLQLLTESGDMVACLSAARAHLAPGGIVAVEVTDFQAGGADGADPGDNSEGRADPGDNSEGRADPGDNSEGRADPGDNSEGRADGRQTRGGRGPAEIPLGDAEGIRLSGDLVHDLAGRTSRYRRRFVGDGWMVEDEVVVRSVDRAELEDALRQAGLIGIKWWENGSTIRTVAIAIGAGDGETADGGVDEHGTGTARRSNTDKTR